MTQTWPGDRSADRHERLEALLGLPDAAVRVEAALPDLLRDGDEALLVAVAEGLGSRATEEPACRVLETLARCGGRVRVAALVALRGTGAPASSSGQGVTPTAGVSAASPVPTATAAGHAPVEAPASAPAAPAAREPVVSPAASESPSAAGVAPSAAPRWDAAFEAVLANPTAATLAQAALALVDLADRRPEGATREAVQALAGRLAMASLDHEGELQSGLARLAKRLEALG